MATSPAVASPASTISEGPTETPQRSAVDAVVTGPGSYPRASDAADVANQDSAITAARFAASAAETAADVASQANGRRSPAVLVPTVTSPGKGPLSNSGGGGTFGVLAPVHHHQAEDLQQASDGRIRNAIPSTLSGKTDSAKGHFSVMLMHSRNQSAYHRASAAERAKQTSESIEAAARKAYEAGYVPLRHRRFVEVPEEQGQQGSQQISQPAGESVEPRRHPASAGTPPVPTYAGPLAPVQTKMEQARLLTLLRSLQPVLVVDQLCKALAYFGGIPGGIPPPDGNFPNSDAANGSGHLFVSWISEIFPRLGHEPDWPRQPVSEAQSVPMVRPARPDSLRRRGRPMGSKASHPRSDKGIKKGPKTGPLQGEEEGDDSWVDVEDSVMDVDANLGQEQEDGAAGGSQAAAGLWHGANAPSQGEVSRHARSRRALHAPPTIPPRKPGRPKGSKDKTPRRPRGPRVRRQAAPDASSQATGLVSASTAVVSPGQPSTIATPIKNKGGRPKGSKNKPKAPDKPEDGATYSTPTSGAPVAVAAATTTIATGSTSTSTTGTTPAAAPRKVSRVPLPNIPAQAQSSAPVPAPVPRSTSSVASGPNNNHTVSPPKRKRTSGTDGQTQVAVDATLASEQASAPNEASLSASNGVANPAKRLRGSNGTAPVQPAAADLDAHLSLDEESDADNLAALRSPQPAVFDVQSPTMENYEAQLQAQFEQQNSAPSRQQTAAQPSRSSQNAAPTWQQSTATQPPVSTSFTSNHSQSPTQYPAQFTQSSNPYGTQFAAARAQQQQASSIPQQQQKPTGRNRFSPYQTSQPLKNHNAGVDSGYRSGSSSYTPAPSSLTPSNDGPYRSVNGQTYRPQPQQPQPQQQHQQQQKQAQRAPQRQPPSNPNFTTPSNQQAQLQQQGPYSGYGDQSGLFSMSELPVSYGGVPRNTNSGGTAFVSASMGSFDSSAMGQGSNERYYGVGRR